MSESKKIKIGNREINAPTRKALKTGEYYFIPMIESNSMCRKLYLTVLWNGHDIDYNRLNQGLIFLTKDDAIACTEAIIELLNGGYQEIEKTQEIEEKDFTTKRVYIPYP